MHIKVKGVSGHLVFVLDDSQEFNNLIKELEGLLDSPLFKSNGFYPKAFFDFKSRILSVRELTCLLDLLFEKQVLLFDGINMIKKEPKNKINNTYITSLKTKLENYFGTKVSINDKKNKGNIQIEYYSPEDLNRILGLIYLNETN